MTAKQGKCAGTCYQSVARWLHSQPTVNAPKKTNLTYNKENRSSLTETKQKHEWVFQRIILKEKFWLAKRVEKHDLTTQFICLSNLRPVSKQKPQLFRLGITHFDREPRSRLPELEASLGANKITSVFICLKSGNYLLTMISIPWYMSTELQFLHLMIVKCNLYESKRLSMLLNHPRLLQYNKANCYKALSYVMKACCI